MEEVWKDMNLSSLSDHQAASSTDYRSVMLQDFLARSPYDSPSSQDMSSSSFSPASPLVTALSLGNINGVAPPPFPKPNNNNNNNNNPFPSLSSTPPSPSFRYKSHFPDPHFTHPSIPPIYNVVHNHTHTDFSAAGFERHKRMIKNRESAARSRARKQAYTNELEQKVEYLTRENERLRKQQEEWSKALPSDKKKNTLFRTSTAPF